MTFGSLFAGVGGMDLGLERAGMTCAWQVEIDPFCRKVLAKHWPDVPRHDDVKKFPPSDVPIRRTEPGVGREVGGTGTRTEFSGPDPWKVDLICGGFPCQDISNAGRRAGIDGERSGLWSEYVRVIRLLRPRYVIVENVAAILVRGRGFDRVLGDLAESGYDAEWDCLPAGAFGAAHIRDRCFVVAYPRRQLQPPTRRECAPAPPGDPGRQYQRGRGVGDHRQEPLRGARQDTALLPDPESRRARQLRWQECPPNGETRWHLYWQEGKPPLPRVADGIPSRVDRLTSLGNAVVPQIARWLGELVLEFDSLHGGT
jgi:DNA (cytosine-5)-methyltransferase 1